MNKNQFSLTEDGKKKLEEELNKLVNIEKPKIIEDLSNARSQGDLKENADYDAAKKKFYEIDNRINEIRSILANSEIIINSDNEFINIGSKVIVKADNKKNNDTYLIVSTVEADPLNNKISNESPLGSALIGHKINDIVKVKIKENSYNVKIIDIKK